MSKPAAEAREFEEILVQRLQQHEEKMKVHRQLVQEQRQWLLQGVVGSQPSRQTSASAAAPTPTQVEAKVPGQEQFSPGRAASPLNSSSGALSQNKLVGAPAEKQQKEISDAQEMSVSQQRPGAVVDRLLSHGQLTAQRLAESRLAAQEQRLLEEQRSMQRADLPARRAVTPSTSQQRELRSQMKKKQLLESELAEITGTPLISAQSAHLAAKRRQQEHREGIDISDSLLIRDQQTKAEKWLRIQYYASQEVPAKPDITEKAARIVSDRPAGDRLYEDAVQRKAEQTLLQNELRALVDESLELTHHPVITPRARQLRRKEGHTASNDLYDQAVKLREAKEAEIELTKRLETELARKKAPRIDPVSSMIAGRLQESATARLLKPKATQRQQEVNADASSSEHRRRAASATAAQRLKDLHAESYRRQAKRLELAQAAELKEVEGCTFQPAIKKVDRYLAHEEQRKDVSERSLQWAQRREQRIQDMAQEKLERERDQCSFAPTISRYRNGTSATTPMESQLYGGDGKAWGYHEFLERQHAARLMKQDQAAREAAVFAHGTLWTGNTTTPSPPKIHPLSSTKRLSESPVRVGHAVQAPRPRGLAAVDLNLVAEQSKSYPADTLQPTGVSESPAATLQQPPASKVPVSDTAAGPHRQPETHAAVGYSPALQRAMEALQKAQRVSSLIAER
jgi:hypothetical protein